MKNWGELKSAVAALLYDSGGTLEGYEAFLPSAANYALNEAARFVDPIILCVGISHRPQENLLGKASLMAKPVCSPVSFTANNGVALYFECDGNAQASIKRGGETVSVITAESSGIYKGYKAVLDSPGEITLDITSQGSCFVRNAAIYGQKKSDNASDVEAFSQNCSYDIAQLTKNENNEQVFLAFADEYPIVRRDEDGVIFTGQLAPYTLEKNGKISLSRDFPGEYDIRIKKKPLSVSSLTADEDELGITEAAAEIAPLYIAWRLYKEDDERLATMYFNEYVAAKNALIAARNSESKASAKVRTPLRHKGALL